MNYGLNLLPEDLRPRPLVDKRRIGIIGAVTVVSALIVLGGAGWLWSFFHQRLELSAVEAQLAYLKPAVQRYDSEKAQETKYQADARTLRGLVARQRYWEPVLEQIQAVLPVDVWLTSLELTYEQPGAAGGGKGRTGVPTGTPAGRKVPPLPNVLVIKGRSRSFSSIGVFQNNLSVAAPGAFGFIRNGRPLFNKASTQVQQVLEGNHPRGHRVILGRITGERGGAWSFSLTCYLNPW
ncbi:MAG: hypothetical protein M0Z41_14905 [Peptococcaceae bacterium]|nr:hypothetical protein [Peptococcaceae bacterium]